MSDDKRNLLSRPMIAVDMDHVMADTGSYLCDWLNERYDTSHDNESFVSLLSCLPDDQKQAMVAHVAEGSLMRDLPLMEGCREVLEDLNERFAITICTAAMEFPNTIAPKIDWLDRHFPFLERQLFIFCGYKQVLGTHYLVDDSPKHFNGFQGIPLLYDAPHNQAVSEYRRVTDWNDIQRYFASRH
ncbi:hypothetical protein ACFFUB_02620 [Algimonas porphyrae]|uniref:5'(3')-deoxyribonucleotidase n=1 Tax=Algimonas porphyrae TaxID=1128113 RepID=A0ABQ5V184_9PROT|nr:hypothetical protein [Algimonas porphyrae]GLQ20346.1 5'(3')-deoxyribonucleotidase [Algimonas porphyrae]